MKLGRFLVLAYLVLMPWSGLAFPKVTGHDYARIVQLGVMLSCAVCLALARPPLPWPGTASGRWVAGLMAVLTVISVSMAAEPAWAAREVCLTLGLAGVAWTVASVNEVRDLRWDAAAVVLAMAFYGALEMSIAALSLLNHQPLHSEEFSLGYSYRRFLNHVQTVALPLLALAASWPGRHALFRAAAWFGLSVGFALLLFTGGRATLLGIVVAAGLGHVLFGRKVRRMLLHLAGGMAAGAAIYGLVFIGGPLALGLPAEFELGNRAQDAGSVMSRWVLWEIAAAHIQASPWWGIGPMHFSHHPNMDAAHPHNIYLQIAAEWGIPMLLLVLLACHRAGRRWLLALRGSDLGESTALGCGLLLTMIAVACDGFLSGNLVMPVSQMWIAALAGWSVAWLRTQPPSLPPPTATAAWGPRAAAMALLVSQLGLWLLILPEVIDLPSWLETVQAQVPTRRTNPRLWSHGWF